jgi:hypothetical protein
MLAVTINNDGLKKVVDKQDNPSVPIKDNPRVSVTLFVREYKCDIHPIKQDSLPVDYDALVDRKNDLTYHDRTLFDERMAIMITDYVNIINSLIKLAEDNKVKKALVDNILEQSRNETFCNWAAPQILGSGRTYGFCRTGN